MKVSQDKAVADAVALLATLQEVGLPPDLTEAEVAAYEAMFDTVISGQQAVPDAKFELGTQIEVVNTTWKELWALCDSIERIAAEKPLAPSVKAAILKKDSSGGFTNARAGKRVRNLLGALTQFPEDFTALGKSKTELLAELRSGIAADELKAEKKSALKAARADLREAVAALDAETVRILNILRASHRRGTQPRDVLDRMGIRKPAPVRKKRKPKVAQTTQSVGETA